MSKHCPDCGSFMEKKEKLFSDGIKCWKCNECGTTLEPQET